MGEAVGGHAHNFRLSIAHELATVLRNGPRISDRVLS
jgi:hypothetical protein